MKSSESNIFNQYFIRKVKSIKSNVFTSYGQYLWMKWVTMKRASFYT